MEELQVILIGGPPGAGKTTLGRALAARLGWACLTVDDLLTVAQQVTTPESHPGLFVMKQRPSMEYFTESSVEQLMADSETQHEAVWPLIKVMVEKHTRWERSPIVIDGWHLRPPCIAGLNLESVWAAWLIPDPEVLRAREAANQAWLQGSQDPQRMLENFMARSLWFNRLVEQEAVEHDFPVIHQPGDVPVETLCEEVLTVLAGEPGAEPGAGGD